MILTVMTLAGRSSAIANATHITDQGTAPEFIWLAEGTDGHATLCSAVLATPMRMITAAHCINGDKNWPAATSNFGLLQSAMVVFGRGSSPNQDDVWANPVATFTPGPDHQISVWTTDSPMDFDLPTESTFDLAVIPLDQRIPSNIAVPAVLPFDPDGTLHSCGSSFTGRFRGYGWTSSSNGHYHYLGEGWHHTSLFGSAYREQYSAVQVAFDSLPVLQDIYELFSTDGISQVLQHGDSGGPLYRGQKLCGINSATYVFPDCHLCIPFVDADCTFPPTFFSCDLDVENFHTEVDTAEARDFLVNVHQGTPPLSLLVDSKGNWIGTCGGKGPASLQDVDTDHDGIPDACDPCPTVFDAQYHDTGVYTNYTDSDGDGIPDICDNCPFTDQAHGDPGRVLIGNRWAQPDSDGDGIGDACDTCPNSDVRANADKNAALQSDWVCCSSDADCSGTDVYGDHTSRCVPLPGPGEPISITNPELGFAPYDCTLVDDPNTGKPYVGRCSFGKDADDDNTSDQCDNCPGLGNDQSDADGDGIGDACDNCRGINQYPDPQHHEADRNDVPSMECDADGVPDAAGESYCKSLNSDPHSVCVPGKIVNGVLKPAYCSKFPDSDYPKPDGIGDACDNCPYTYNYQPDLNGVSPGILNGQPNCNLLAEVAGGIPYPYIGDACDPSPCNRPFRQGWKTYPPDWADDGTHGDLWAITSYDPAILPNSYAPSFRSPETYFDNTYTGTPVARVGARVCDCGLDQATGKFRNAWQCHKLGICPIDPTLYNKIPYRIMKTYANTSTDLQASPLTLPSHPGPLDFGLDGENGEVTDVALEAAAGTTPTTTGSNPDNLPPFLGSPTYVAWDLGQSGATDLGVKYGYGIIGVYWTAVRDVPQVLSGVTTTKPFVDWSNKYSSGYLGRPGVVAGLGLTKSTCPFCDLGDCTYCRKRICMACLPSAEARSLVVSPAAGRVYAQTSQGALDITSEFSPGALEAISATGTRWVTSAERGGWIGANGLAFSVLSTDGTTVEATLVAGADGTQGVTLLGRGRIAGSPQVAAGISLAGSSPPPRSDFGAVLSGREQAVFVIGGELESGGLARDLWMYDLTDLKWSQLPFTGPAPEKVIASTYIADTRSLYLVDQTDQNPVLARLLRYDFATGAFVQLGQWPRTVVFDRVDLSGSYEGNLLLSGSSKLTNHVAGVVLRPSVDKVEVIGAFLRKGVLAVEPTLGATALTLPLVSDSPTGSTDTVIPNKEVFFPTHEKPQHTPKGPPCNDYRCPPHLTIGDVL